MTTVNELKAMGSDGLEGMRVLKAKGGRALAQSDSTCVVYGMFDRRARACARVLALLREKFGSRLFATVIGLDTKFREASANGQVISDMAPDSRGAREYAQLAEEVLAL